MWMCLTKKSPESLVKYMVDVAMGMHYIAERGLVHRVSIYVYTMKNLHLFIFGKNLAWL